MFTLSPNRWSALASLAICFALAASGCGGGDKRYPVKGKVTLDGTELKAGAVNFVPDAAKNNKTKNAPMGKIGEDGTYTLTTDGKDGAPAGWYKVTVTTNMPGMGATTPGATAEVAKVEANPKYSDPSKTDLAVEVVASPPAGQYDLKLTR